MNTLRIQQGNNIEVVTTDIIKKLYDVALSIPTPLEGETDPVYLSGNLLVDKTYATYVEYLTGRFPDLHINVTGAYYVAFEDPEVERILKTTVSSDGVGVTTVDCENVTSFTTLGLSGNTSILTFDELKYFTNIKSLPQSCLSGTANITKINLRNIESIGNYALGGKASLSDVVSSSNLRTIGTGAFNHSTSLLLIDLTNVTSLGDEAFGWSGIQNVNCPNLLTMTGGVFRESDVRTVTDLGNITTLSEAAFWNCSNLTSVTLPATLTTIGNKPFKNCSALLSVTGLTNVTTIPYECFLECRSLTSLTIPATVTTIYDYAFANCRALHTLSFDHGYIGGQHTFENCLQLNKIHVNNIASWYTISATRHSDAHPMSCNSLTKQLFDSNGDHVTALVLPEGVTAPTNVSETEVGRAFWYTDITSVDFPSTLTVATGFNHCSSLASIDISKCTNLTTIGRLGFSECSNLVFDVSNLPQTVTSIEDSAFYGCSKVTGALNLPNVTYVGGSGFRNSGITSITDLGSVTGLGYYNFAGCSNLSSVVLPSTCITLGLYAFYGSGNNTGTINTGNITTMGNGALAESKFIGSVDLSNVSTFDKNLIRLSKFTNLILPWTAAQRLSLSTYGFECIDSASSVTTITTDWSQWTVLPHFAGYTNLQPFVMYQPLLTSAINKPRMFGMTLTGGRTDGMSRMYHIYWPGLTTVTNNNYRGERDGIIGGYNGGVITDLVYLKNISTLEAGSFFYSTISALVINNTTVPTIPDTYNNTTAGFLYDGWSGLTINNIYVPDSAVLDYKNAWGSSTQAAKIHGISELNTDGIHGVIYATEADWVAAGKPVGLIAEYLGLNSADLASFVTANNLTYWTNPNA